MQSEASGASPGALQLGALTTPCGYMLAALEQRALQVTSLPLHKCRGSDYMTWSRLSIQGSLVGVMGLSGDKDLMCSQLSSPGQGGVCQMFHCPLSHQLLRGWALCSHSSTWDARLKWATGSPEPGRRRKSPPRSIWTCDGHWPLTCPTQGWSSEAPCPGKGPGPQNCGDSQRTGSHLPLPSPS